MRLAVISDIHGNLEAFHAILADMDRAGIDGVVSLGDNIGYGPDHEAVMAEIRRRNIPSVVGNHELVARKPLMERWFNPTLRRTLRDTAASLSRHSLDAIRAMPNYLVRDDCRFVHGFPPFSPTLYVFQMDERAILRAFSRISESICFIGHTHDLGLIVIHGATVSRLPLVGSPVTLPPDRRFLVNAGSVGQPRDGDNRAKYVIFDDAEHTLDVRYVPYDIEAVVRKILALGYPEHFALRLR